MTHREIVQNYRTDSYPEHVRSPYQGWQAQTLWDVSWFEQLPLPECQKIRENRLPDVGLPIYRANPGEFNREDIEGLQSLYDFSVRPRSQYY